MVSAQVPYASLGDTAIPQLLQSRELVRQTSRLIGPEVMRRRAVVVDAELLMTLDPAGDNQIVFNLFPDTTFTGRVESKTFPCKLIGFPDAFSLGGSIQGIPGGTFQLLYLQGALATNIWVPGKGEYQIRPTAPGPPGSPGTHEVWEIDSSHVSECAAGRPLQFIPPAADKAVGQSTSFLVESGAVIEVLLVYTTDARIAMGGEINIIIETAFAVINTNTVFEDSLINTKLRFVDLREITYAESGIASTDLSRLTDIGDGYLDSLHTIRDETGADIVSLFVSSLDVCGTSWLMSNVSHDFRSWAFNVSAIGCVGLDFTFTHQIGHTLGCQHNREDAGGVQGAFPYSYGYWDPVGGFRTVMSLPNGSPLLRQFSNPLVVQTTGIPTGIPEGQPNSADNAKTINNTAFTVANFLQSYFCNPSVDFDCNTNCIEDDIDIAEGTSLDCNINGIPDECEADCNGNGIPDTCEIADGRSFDCNSNSIPDSCDIANGSSLDCNSNNVPDECEDDCNSNCIEDAIDIANGTSLDCNANGIPDECEVDCNGNGIPDSCDLTDGRSFDCNSNTIPDECEDDCNRNGIPDTCDIADGRSSDCNSNSIPDECEVRSDPFFSEASGELSPIGLGLPVSHTFTSPPAALDDVTLQFTAIADLESIFWALDVYLNDVFLERIFRLTGSNCPTTPDEDELVVAMADFNTLVNGGDAVIRIETFDSVEFDACAGTSWVSVSMNYLGSVSDANNNGIPDSCDLARGDSNLDGVINVTDLLNLLAAWGVCGNCVQDTDDDGLVNITDLLTLLSNWG